MTSVEYYKFADTIGIIICYIAFRIASYISFDSRLAGFECGIQLWVLDSFQSVKRSVVLFTCNGGRCPH